MISIKDINVYYGRVQALKELSVDISDGELVTVIGANGAGKSTLLKTISGELHPRSGRIEFDGTRIDHLEPHKVVNIGIVQIPEGKRLFPKLTVMENLKMGAFSLGNQKQRIDTCLERVLHLFPALAQRKQQLAGSLSGGEQQMLAIGRGLMADPKILLLDEPSLGLAPKLVSAVTEALKEINKEGKTILLVEQNMVLALSMAQRAYVLERGRVILSGGSADLLHNDEVRRAYLGRV